LKKFSLTLASIVFPFTALLIEPPLPVFAQEKQVAGWVEYVSLYPGNLKIKAKLDTGARNSSLNADTIDTFERNGETWLRFSLTNWKGRIETFEAEIIRIAKIKQHNSKAEKRPVIRLGICLGKIFKEVEVNLVDRGKFNYQLLIGRSFLKGSFIVDPSLTFTIDSSCRGVIDP
jgi:hypothetical protein